MDRIISSILDTDAYTFTVQYYVLKKFPSAKVKYSFFDRNNIVYPKGFGEKLKDQVNKISKSIRAHDCDISFLKSSFPFIEEWYFNFLKGYKFNSDEVKIEQDEEGHLKIDIEGYWWSTIMWEQPLLATISEMYHKLKDDYVIYYSRKMEVKRAYHKAMALLMNGVKFADMGTRRRMCYDVHEAVIEGFVKAQQDYDKYCETHHEHPYGKGKFLGTSNVELACGYNLPVLGTISHQLIQGQEAVSNVAFCNGLAMQNWKEVFGDNLNMYLYDCFGDDIFFLYLSKENAHHFNLRIDSGDNYEQRDKIIEAYKKNGVDPLTKTVCFSNALDIPTAIEIHKDTYGKIDDIYGIGTEFTCGFKNVNYFGQEVPEVKELPIKPLNIVIKLTSFQKDNLSEQKAAVKLSCDKGKTVGDKKRVEEIQRLIKEHIDFHSN